MKVDTAQIDQVRASLNRCLGQAAFLDRFYEHFLGSSNEIRQMFVHTDFKRQKFMLAASLKTMLLFARGGAVGESGRMQELARVHNKHNRNISPQFYAYWLDALLLAVKESDPEQSAQLVLAWRNTMQMGINYMISHYSDAEPVKG